LHKDEMSMQLLVIIIAINFKVFHKTIRQILLT